MSLTADRRAGVLPYESAVSSSAVSEERFRRRAAKALLNVSKGPLHLSTDSAFERAHTPMLEQLEDLRARFQPTAVVTWRAQTKSTFQAAYPSSFGRPLLKRTARVTQARRADLAVAVGRRRVPALSWRSAAPCIARLPRAPAIGARSGDAGGGVGVLANTN